MKENAKQVDYTIHMSGKLLKEYLKDKLVFGDPNQIIKFRDLLIDPQGQVDTGQVFETKDHPTDPTKLVLAKPETWKLRTNKLEENAPSYDLDDARPGADNLRPANTPAEIGSFELNVEFEKANPHVAIVTIKGPINQLYNYAVEYPTKVTNQAGVQPGTAYSNRIELLATDYKYQAHKAYTATIEATAEATPGFGHFRIEKRIAGSTAEQVTGAHTVTVNYTYELPLPANSYANWTPPGTLNADQRSGSAACVINFRKGTLCLNPEGVPGDLLPRNSKVFINAQGEDLTSISAENRDLKWSAPQVELP